MADGNVNGVTKHNINVSNLVGQAYDVASVMSGSEGGVQNLLSEAISTKEQEAVAPYVHCPTHQLNVVLAHAAENNESVKSIFSEWYNCSILFLLTRHKTRPMLKEKCKMQPQAKSSLFDDLVAEDEDDDGENERSADAVESEKR